MKLLAVGIGLLILTSCASTPTKLNAMAAQTAVEINNGATHAVNDVRLIGDAARHIGADFSAVVGAVNRIKDAAENEPSTP